VIELVMVIGLIGFLIGHFVAKVWYDILENDWG
jgi:hypothetical protein